MIMASWSSRAKILLTFINVVFSLLGLGCIICGLVIKFHYGPYLDVLLTESFTWIAEYSSVLPILFLVAGCLILIISLCGFFGAKQENVFLLKIYKVVLLTILLFVIVIAILAITYTSTLQDIVYSSIKNLFQTYKTSHEAIDFIQTSGQCCGVYSYLDWKNDEGWLDYTAELALEGRDVIPLTCCDDPESQDATLGVCEVGNEEYFHFYHGGCAQQMWRILQSNNQAIGNFGIAVTSFLLFGILLSCVVIRFIQQGGESISEELTV